MPKIFENKVVYDYPPSYTLSLLHQKYPNPHATHVVSVDTISRHVDPDTGIVRSERVIGVEQGAPKWISKVNVRDHADELFKLPPTAYVREVIFVDPTAPTATMMSENLNYAEYVSCLELISYTPHGESQGVSKLPNSDPPESSQTLFHQRALLVSGFRNGMIARRIEAASLDRFAANAGVGKMGFDWVLARGQSQSPQGEAMKPP